MTDMMIVCSFLEKGAPVYSHLNVIYLTNGLMESNQQLSCSNEKKVLLAAQQKPEKW